MEGGENWGEVEGGKAQSGYITREKNFSIFNKRKNKKRNWKNCAIPHSFVINLFMKMLKDFRKYILKILLKPTSKIHTNV